MHLCLAKVEGTPHVSAPSLHRPRTVGPEAPTTASPGRRKVVLVAMLISCRCSSVSVWKRRMEEPEEKAIQTPLPAFTMCVTLTASSWCASKLCCGRDRGCRCWAGSASRASGDHANPARCLNQSQGWKETSGAQQWRVDNCLTAGRGSPARRVCRFLRCKYFERSQSQATHTTALNKNRERFTHTWLSGVDRTRLSHATVTRGEERTKSQWAEEAAYF